MMRQISSFLRTAIAALLLLGNASAVAGYDFGEDGIYYNINGDGSTVSVTSEGITGWLTYTKNLTVPAYVTHNGTTYTVTALANGAFQNCSQLTSVTLPASLTTIGDAAFLNCGVLTSVDFPASVISIGDEAFRRAYRLTSIALGPSVSHIGNNAFTGCTALTSISVDTANPTFDSRNGCNAIIETATGTLVYGFKTTVVPHGVTAIGDAAFYQNYVPDDLVLPTTVTVIGDRAFSYSYGMQTINIPNSVTYIGENAFTHCNSLTALNLPASVTAIGTDAFAGCWSIATIAVDAGNPVYDSRQNCNALIETATGTLIKGCVNTIIPMGVTAIGKDAFSWSKVTDVIIPTGVTAIGDNAFDHCYEITRLSLPGTLLTIGDNAFDAAYKFNDLTIPGSVTSIGKYAFHCCNGLSGIRFDEGSPLVLGDYAFYQCSGLKSVVMPNTLQSVGDYCFFECDSLTSVFVSASVSHIGCAAFGGCPLLAEMKVDSANPVLDARDSCNAIIETASGILVAGCLATVIPDGVTALGDGAFAECIGLNTIFIPEGVTRIGEYAFDCCYDLDTIALPHSLVTIGDYAFASCEALVYMTIPDAVTTIGASAFYDCPWMSYLTLGKGLSFIGDGAFNGCNLLKVNCRANIPPVIAAISSFWHYGEFSNAILKVPAQALQRYQNADYWSLFPQIVADGDLTGDGRVNMDDLTAMIGCLVGYGTTDLQYFTADVNNDNRFNMDDLTTLINWLVFGYGWPESEQNQ